MLPNANHNLIEINQSYSDRALVIIHPIGGSIACYYELGRSLEPSIKLYSIASPEFDGNDYNFDAVASLATCYLSYIDDWDDPNITLCGYSFGGVIAHEMAYQLKLKGVDLDSITLIDSYFFQDLNYDCFSLGVDLSKPALILKFITDLLAISDNHNSIFEFISDHLEDELLLAHCYDIFIKSNDKMKNLDYDTFSRLYYIFERNCDLYSKYYPKKSNINITMIRPYQRLHNCINNPDNTWKNQVTDYYQKHYIPGDHHNILHKPEALAQLLR